MQLALQKLSSGKVLFNGEIFKTNSHITFDSSIAFLCGSFQIYVTSEA